MNEYTIAIIELDYDEFSWYLSRNGETIEEGCERSAVEARNQLFLAMREHNVNPDTVKVSPF